MPKDLDLVDVFSEDPEPVKLISLVIPVYNEEKNLPLLVNKLMKVSWPAKVEWVFVDDASTDNSAVILETIAKRHKHAKVLLRPVNVGKGAALIVGINAAKGQVIAIQDADLEYDPDDLVKLIKAIKEDKADVVYGSRFGQGQIHVHRTFHRLINLFLTHLSNICSGLYVSDMETCYKVFRRSVLQNFALNSKRFGFEPEVTAYISKFRLRILEFPVSYYPRSYIQGKKIGWKDGIAALWCIFKYNFITNRADCLKQDFLLDQRILAEKRTDQLRKAG